jgi:hypothetical protein
MGKIAYDRWINRQRIWHTTLRGLRLRKYYQQCQISRNLRSKVDGKEIEDELPCHQGRLGTVKHAALPLRRLIRVDHETGKMTQNFEPYRMLILLAVWPGMHHVHHKFMLKTPSSYCDGLIAI